VYQGSGQIFSKKAQSVLLIDGNIQESVRMQKKETGKLNQPKQAGKNGKSEAAAVAGEGLATAKTQGTRAALREEILAGLWKPGTFLPSVRKLGERFQTPKSSIHNILKLLQEEGLLQLHPTRGARVNHYSPEQPCLRRFFLRPSDFGSFNYLPGAAGLINGVMRGAEKKNAEILLSFTDSENVTEEILEAFHAGEIQGVIYGQCRNYKALIDPLEKAKVPYVVAHDIHHLEVLKCFLDYRKIVQQAMEYLLARGHREIAFWCGSPDDFIYREGIMEYLRLVDEYHLEFHKEWLEINVISAEKYSGGFFRQKKMPSAVITMRDYRAKIFFEQAAACGLKIPQDISVLSWDNNTWPGAERAGLTTYLEPLSQLGEMAVKLLQQWVVEGIRPENFQAECPLIERDSVQVLR